MKMFDPFPHGFPYFRDIYQFYVKLTSNQHKQSEES